MKKKSLLMMLASLALVGTIMVGATFAYFTSTTESAKNVFTVGNNLEIELWEDVTQASTISQNFVFRGDAVTTVDTADFRIASLDQGAIFKNMYEGLTLNKKPYVKNITDQPCYVRVVVTGADELISKGFLVNKTINNSGWVKVDANPSDFNGIWEYQTAAIPLDTDTAPLFDSVTFNEIVLDDNDDPIDYSTLDLNIGIKAYAVQSFGFTSATAAFEAEEVENDGSSPVANAFVVTVP